MNSTRLQVTLKLRALEYGTNGLYRHSLTNKLHPFPRTTIGALPFDPTGTSVPQTPLSHTLNTPLS